MKRTRILVIDDDDALRYLCGVILLKQGYQVEFAAAKQEAEEIIRENTFELVVLDLNLPDGNGLELGKILLAAGIPFLVMTSRGQPDERCLGFEAGAADYLIKPFHPEELLHRVQRILSRKGWGEQAGPVRRWRLGEWMFDFDRQGMESITDGRLLELTRGEYRLLAALAEAGGRVVSRDRLINVVAREEGEGHYRTVDVLVSRLRRKLDDNPRRPTILLTVVGSGYRLAAEPATDRRRPGVTEDGRSPAG